jgi:hypothetical protein
VAVVTRRIGLSLGADLCWPLCFEHLVKRLNLSVPVGGDTVRFEVERVAIQPFNLREPVGYDVVVDRLTHWMHSQREWIKKGLLMDGLYVFNNPWSVQANEKHTSYAAMMKLGMPVPETWMLPAKAYGEDQVDAKVTLKRYAKLFDLKTIGEKLGFPFFMKPYDGGGWRNVTRVKTPKEAWTAYDESGKSVMHAQASVEGYDAFVRTIGFGPQTRMVSYAPDAPLHDRYTQKVDFLPKAEAEHLRKVTLTINAFFGWDFNSCESLRKNGVWHPIDFANPCPDSQVTSLHFHFPWLVKAYVKWTLFCAATKRPFRKNLDWQPFYDVAAMDLPYLEKLDRYAKIADERFETARFDEFCAKDLKHLDAEAFEFFATTEAKEAVRLKVAALFPAHEVEKFTELFWQRIQAWRAAGCP